MSAQTLLLRQGRQERLSPRSSSAVLRPSSRRACPPPFLLKDFFGDSQVCPRLWRNGRRFHRHSPRLSLLLCFSPAGGGWQPHLPWWACSVMATTSPVSLTACLIKAKPVVAESPVAAEAAPDLFRTRTVLSSVCLVTAVNGRLRRTVLADINSASSTPLRRFLRFRTWGYLWRGFV